MRNKLKIILFIIVCLLLIILPITTVYAATSDNINEPSGLTVDTVEQILPDTLKDYAQVFIDEEEEHSINLLFVAAIAQQETQSGTQGTAVSRNNLFGNRSKKGYMRFDSFEESIVYQFDVLDRLYFSKGKDTIKKISKKYCVPPEHWANAVISIFNDYVDAANDIFKDGVT